MRAIISVSDKSGITDFAKGLEELGFELFSTGGTKKSLAEAGVLIHGVSDITGFPEILDGRVKTLHPMVHGGLLARRDLPSHMAELTKNNISPIDLVAVNLYPFVQAVSKDDITIQEALENIDIGGPTMIRASAKNFPGVIVIVDPADYDMVLSKLESGGLDITERKCLAQKAFQHVAAYDTAISQHLRQDIAGFPDVITISLKKRYDLRYGENPHQQAAFYAEQNVVKSDSGITWAKQLWGKELSFNNILDAEAAWTVASDFTEPTVAIIKHTNPCGLASHKDIDEAYRRAFSGDTISAYGGIVACNRTINLKTVKEMEPTFYEIVIAPNFDDDALVELQKKKNLRIMQVAQDHCATKNYLNYRRVRGGMLVQQADTLKEDNLEIKVVTKRAPAAAELDDLKFAWRAAKYLKSNAIVLAKDQTMLGMGCGQPNRAVSVFLSKIKAGEKSRGAVLASDAFFPFSDGIIQAADGGISAIIQPGGSIRDEDCIKAADEHDIAMVFTGIRHFLH
jgi:phosphoribosylaminoimidazolecarboxamide formyltransferase/IMP cyclohydrolase